MAGPVWLRTPISREHTDHDFDTLFTTDKPIVFACDKLIEHKEYIALYGDDMLEIMGWKWGEAAATGGVRSTEADNV